MNSRQRVEAAMRHRTVDRVPVMCQLALGHYFLHGDRAPSEIWFDSQAFVETLSQFQRRYGFDGFLINLPGRPTGWREWLADNGRVVADARPGPAGTTGQGERLVWNDGRETWFPPDDSPRTTNPGGAPLPRANLEHLDPENPATYRVAGYLWNTWHAPTLWDVPEAADLRRADELPEWFDRALRLARAACADVSVHAEVFSPFTHLLELLGYDQALLGLADSPGTCHVLLDRFTAMVTAQVQRLADHDPDAILISSAFAGAGFVSRAMYCAFVLPYEQRVVAAIHDRGLLAYTHTCGAIGDRLDLLASSGTDGIDTLDPPPLGTVDLARVKAEWGSRLFLKGNLDAVHEMLQAGDETFERAVLERLRIGKPGSGYVLSSACSVAPHVHPQRLRRMVELAREF